MRKTERFPVSGGRNPFWQLYQRIPFWKIFKNTCWIVLARYLPFFSWKNRLYRKWVGIQIGADSVVAFRVMMDILYPEKIEIGENSIIGYNTTILTHEYLISEYRIGRVVIGNHVLIGANTTILPGVTIGDHAVVGAGSVVTKDVPPHSFVAGNPIRMIRDGSEKK